ncbi:MAG: hypothetical protein VYC96_04325, partial [Actinomycetota bacterium]|nr:hypothetical protein [Actinomycetota bacterium]
MTGTSARSRPAAGGVLRGGGRLVGFGLSVALLAASSLLLIPAMVDAGGQRAWGAIAVGQSIGAVAAVIIYFGWGHTGPATIARTDADSGRREFSDSLRTRLVLFAPVALLSSGLAALVSPTNPLLAAVGCLSAASVGFTADWYFVGSRRPFAFLALETAPRVLGSLVGIGLLMNGAPVIFGPVSMLGGMLVGFAATSWWVLRRRAPVLVPARTVREVIIAQWHGVGSGAGTAAYAALPLVLISLIAPA